MTALTGWPLVVVIASLIIACVALGLSIWVWRTHATSARLVPAPAPGVGVAPVAQAPAPRLVAFVANPSKPDVAALREPLERACSSLGYTPVWLETTIEDPGIGQAKQAIEMGAEVVIAAGGDGTVRAVAQALGGTGVPMGLLPVGTGNLLARNLDLPITDLSAALEIALEGRDRSIDVGWLKVTGVPDDGEGDLAEVGAIHNFLVIAGVGFDAAMVADTNTTLKAKVGWIAYFISGIRHLHGKRLQMAVRLDDRPAVQAQVRTLLIGNCGRLPGGLTLIPDAVVDDGLLDIAAIDTRGGMAGWAQLFGEVVLQGWGVQTIEGVTKIGRIDHTQCARIAVRIRGGEQAQVDGDIIGRASAIESWVEPGSLVVRAPRTITLGR